MYCGLPQESFVSINLYPGGKYMCPREYQGRIGYRQGGQCPGGAGSSNRELCTPVESRGIGVLRHVEKPTPLCRIVQPH
jgi:hypothetical protein